MGKSKVYVCPTEPKLKIRLGKRRITFAYGQLTLDDAKEIALLDALLEEKVELARLIKVVDREKAEEIALQHREAVHMGMAAQKGGMTAAAMAAQMRNPAVMAGMFHAEGGDPEISDAVAKELAQTSDFTVATPTKEVVRDTGAGFIPAKSAAKVDAASLKLNTEKK